MDLKKKLLNKHTLSLASNAVMPVVGMVTVSLLARNLSGPDFGNWILFLITFTLATLFRSGFTNILSKILCRRKQGTGIGRSRVNLVPGFCDNRNISVYQFFDLHFLQWPP